MNTLQKSLTDSFYTRFYPSLQSFTGSAISTLIIGKLEYWFSIPRYVEGFYKFAEPCGHPLYREGDSWSEELGVSRKLFAKAFDVIGIRYPSKSAFLKAEEPFQGKLYASYHDRRTNQTYYVRNHSFVIDFLKGLFTKKRSSSLDVHERKKDEAKKTQHFRKVQATEETQPLKQETMSSLNSQFSDLSEVRSRSGDLGHSYARVSSSFQKKTSSLNDKPKRISSESIESVDRSLTEEMIKIWKEEVGELGVSSLSHGLLTRLQTTLSSFFEGSLESWKAHCQMIASSKFLMGEAQNKFFKKAWIIWALRGENIERIRAGEFKLGDRKTNHDKKIEAIDSEIKNLEHKKQRIEIKIAHIKSDEREKRKNLVKERIKNLSSEERRSLEQAFEAFLKQENNSMTEEFKKYRWKGMFISVYFDSFVEEKIYAQLFGSLDKDHDDKIVESSGLLAVLDEACYALSLVKQKKRRLESQNFESSPQNRVIDSTVNPMASQLMSSQKRLDGLIQGALSWV